jgi:hypothetical protein
VQQNPFDIGHHIGILKAQDFKALVTAIGVALIVVIGAVVVTGAVEFGNEVGFAAKEVAEIGADRHLAAEFMAIQLAVAEMLPKDAFGWGGLVSELLCAWGVAGFEM